MLDTLLLVLVIYGLGLTLLTGLVLVGAACISAISYSIWLERTGGLPAIAVPSFIAKKKSDIPEGFQEHYRYWTDPVTGRKSLLPKEDVAALEEAMKADQEEENAELDAYIDGKAETVGAWHGR